MIGKNALDDPRNSLIYHFVRLVVELKASYFVFENVRGLTVGAHKRFLEEIIGEFRNVAGTRRCVFLDSRPSWNRGRYSNDK